MLERVARIRSHAGYGRFLGICRDTPYILPRQVDIPSPYAWCATHTVYRLENTDDAFRIIVETSHRCYDVFRVPVEMLKHNPDIDDAMVTIE